MRLRLVRVGQASARQIRARLGRCKLRASVLRAGKPHSTRAASLAASLRRHRVAPNRPAFAQFHGPAYHDIYPAMEGSKVQASQKDLGPAWRHFDGSGVTRQVESDARSDEVRRTPFQCTFVLTK